MSQLNISITAPNLPGMLPTKDSWVYRQKDGFHKTTNQRPRSAAPASSSILLSTESLAQLGLTSLNNNQTADNNRPSTSGGKRPTTQIGNPFANYNLNKTASQATLERPHTASGVLRGSSSMPKIPPSTLAVNEIGLASEYYARSNTTLRKELSIPKFVERDRQVCRFFGYFTESRVWDSESPLGCPTIEKEVVRELTILYYLQDTTVEIHESIKKNGGMSGGNFYKRAPLVKNDGTLLELIDLSPGNTVPVLGRQVHILDADNFTRDFFRRELGVTLAPPMEKPENIREDLGAMYSTGFQSHLPDKKPSHGCCSTDYLEKREGFEKTQKFLHFDGRVLRFQCVDMATLPMSAFHADQSYNHTNTNTNTRFTQSIDGASSQFGISAVPSSVKRFALSFYLADNSIDIRVVKDHGRSSTEENVLVMKRNKIARNWRQVRRGDAPDYYEPMDLLCGTVVDIYGREYLLISCDSFTKAMFEEMGIEQRELPIVQEEIKAIQHPIPQLGDGFLPIGSPEDTLATVYGMPKVSRDLQKIQRNQNRILRCKTKILSSNPIDSTRVFMLTFFLEDDTVQIYEEVQRNSGINGGNFLKRGRYKNHLPSDCEEPRDFKATDIYLGNVISVNGVEMQIIEMDNLSLKFCETYPDEFPMFDTFKIVHRIIAKTVAMKIDLRQQFSSLDPEKKAYIARNNFVEMLDSMNVSEQLNDQEMLTLVRRFQENDKYYYHEMCDLFSHVYCVQNKVDHAVNVSRSRKQTVANSDVVDDLRTFLKNARLRTTQWRRTLRKDNYSVNGKTLLANLCKIFRKHGFILSENTKQLITSNYRLPRDKESQVLRDLERQSQLHVEVDVQKISGGRADFRSENRKLKTMSNDNSQIFDSMNKNSIRNRRQYLMTSVLRKKGDHVAMEDTKTTDDKVVIDFNKLCDDIYICDWA